MNWYWPFVIITLAFAVFIAWSSSASCQAGCPVGLGCNDELICPGDCGCARRPGQPFGRCVAW